MSLSTVLLGEPNHASSYMQCPQGKVGQTQNVLLASLTDLTGHELH